MCPLLFRPAATCICAAVLLLLSSTHDVDGYKFRLRPHSNIQSYRKCTSNQAQKNNYNNNHNLRRHKRLLCHHESNIPEIRLQEHLSFVTAVVKNDDNNSTPLRSRIEKTLFGGVTLSPELVAILTVYFVQGALGLSRLAVTYFMKDELHLDPAEVAALGGITMLPWVIKPVYGFLSDGVPIFGYRRRSYLIIAGILGSLSWLALGSFIHDAPTAVTAIVVGSGSVAISDVVADSIVVEKSRQLALSKEGQQADDDANKNVETATAATATAALETGMSTTVESTTATQALTTESPTGAVANIVGNVMGTEGFDRSVEQLSSLLVPATAAHTFSSPADAEETIAGNLQSLCWSAAAIGGIASAYFSGSLLETVSPRVVFSITALFPLLISAVSFLIDETPVLSSSSPPSSDRVEDNNQHEDPSFTSPSPPATLLSSASDEERLLSASPEVHVGDVVVSSTSFASASRAVVDGQQVTYMTSQPPLSPPLTPSIAKQLALLKETLLDPKIYLPVLFIFCWQATPSPDTAMFYFSTNDLGFQPEFLGRVRLASSLAALLGVFVYRSKLQNVSVKDVIFWTTLISFPLSLTQLLLVTHYNRVLGIPDQLFALTDDVVLTVLGQVAFMPTLVLASSLCPPGVEGTLFASLMSIYNLAGTVSSELGAGLTSMLGITDTVFANLPLLVLLCSIGGILPLAFINLLDVKKNDEDKMEHGEEVHHSEVLAQTLSEK